MRKGEDSLMTEKMLIGNILILGCCSLGLILGCASPPDDEDDSNNGGNGEHGFDGLDDPDQYDNDDLDWDDANLTWYESYPDPNSDECIYYSGCEWAGYLAGVDEQMSEEWVENTHIVAVHSNDWDEYRGKILRIRQGSNQIDAMVYDMCSDSDCNGCCTANSSETGFLIDLEIHTFNEFGGYQGIVQWACLDC